MARRPAPIDPLADVRHGFAPDGARGVPANETQPLADVAAQLIADIRATAANEMALIKARTALASDGARRAAMWGGIAAGMVLIALLAMVFGAILALSPHTGAVVATMIVGGALLALAALAGWYARRGALDIKAAFTEQGDDLHWDDSE